MTRRLHRLLGLCLVAPFLLWTATGLLFLLKPGWRGAYEGLDAFQETPFDPLGVVPLSLAVGKPGESGAAVHVELGSTALGLVYRIVEPETTRIVDARSGTVLSPLERDAAVKVAVDAASRSASPQRYGDVVEAREQEDAVEVVFAGGATVAVGRDDLSIAQYGADSARIDALYRIHYLQWTGVPAIDRPLALAAIAGTWALAVLGLRLFRRPRTA